MKVKTIAGVTYVVSAAGSCTVTARTDDGTAITLCALTSGGQKAFQAIGGEVEVSDSNAVVLPFADASVPLGMEGGVDAGMVAGMVEEAVTEEGEETASTGEGGSYANARYVQIAGMHVPDGVVRGISIKCRNTNDPKMAQGAVFLAVWEKNAGDDGYTRLVSSTEAVAQAANETREWVFEGLRLHGRTIRLVFLEAADAVWPGADGGNWQVMGISCGARGAGDAESAYIGTQGGSNNFLAAVAFRYVVRVARFAGAGHAEDEDVHLQSGERDRWNKAATDAGSALTKANAAATDASLTSHKNDAVAHLTQEEHEGLTGLLANPPQDGAPGAPGKDAELTEEQTEALTWLLTNKENLEKLIAAQAE